MVSACASLRRCAAAPLRRCAAAPLRRYAAAPLRLSRPARLFDFRICRGRRATRCTSPSRMRCVGGAGLPLLYQVLRTCESLYLYEMHTNAPAPHHADITPPNCYWPHIAHIREAFVVPGCLCLAGCTETVAGLLSCLPASVAVNCAVKEISRRTSNFGCHPGRRLTQNKDEIAKPIRCPQLPRMEP